MCLCAFTLQSAVSILLTCFIDSSWWRMLSHVQYKFEPFSMKTLQTCLHYCIFVLFQQYLKMQSLKVCDRSLNRMRILTINNIHAVNLFKAIRNVCYKSTLSAVTKNAHFYPRNSVWWSDFLEEQLTQVGVEVNETLPCFHGSIQLCSKLTITPILGRTRTSKQFNVAYTPATGLHWYAGINILQL